MSVLFGSSAGLFWGWPLRGIVIFAWEDKGREEDYGSGGFVIYGEGCLLMSPDAEVSSGCK